jgi:hypothetical protein
MDDSRAPDYARTVDIHRKPGYDPVELFLDPKLSAPKVRVAIKLAKRKLGLRGLLDVIGLDAGIVQGSHGRPPVDDSAGPVFITQQGDLVPSTLAATEVRDAILRHVFDA